MTSTPKVEKLLSPTSTCCSASNSPTRNTPPSPVNAYTISSATEARAIAVRLGVTPDPSTPTDRLAAAQEQATTRQKELKDQFLVNAARLKEIDRGASVFVTSRITNETYARTLAQTHGHSGRAVVRALVTQ